MIIFKELKYVSFNTSCITNIVNVLIGIFIKVPKYTFLHITQNLEMSPTISLLNLTRAVLISCIFAFKEHACIFSCILYGTVVLGVAIDMYIQPWDLINLFCSVIIPDIKQFKIPEGTSLELFYNDNNLCLGLMAVNHRLIEANKKNNIKGRALLLFPPNGDFGIAVEAAFHQAMHTATSVLLNFGYEVVYHAGYPGVYSDNRYFFGIRSTPIKFIKSNNLLDMCINYIYKHSSDKECTVLGASYGGSMAASAASKINYVFIHKFILVVPFLFEFFKPKYAEGWNELLLSSLIAFFIDNDAADSYHFTYRSKNIKNKDITFVHANGHIYDVKDKILVVDARVQMTNICYASLVIDVNKSEEYSIRRYSSGDFLTSDKDIYDAIVDSSFDHTVEIDAIGFTKDLTIPSGAIRKFYQNLITNNNVNQNKVSSVSVPGPHTRVINYILSYKLSYVWAQFPIMRGKKDKKEQHNTKIGLES